MEDNKWINEYYTELQKAMFPNELNEWLISFKDIVLGAMKNRKKMIFAGNGASTIIGTHGYLDFMNQLGIQCITIDNGSFLTAASNDFGYDNIFKRAVDLLADEGDIVVLVSSSGRSPNVIQATKGARNKNCKVVTFSGFKEDNPLRQLGDVNFWVDNDKYNIVESVHNAWLVSVVDMIIKDNPDQVGIHGIEFDVKGIDNNEIDV